MNRQPRGLQRTTVRLSPDILRALSERATREACTRSHLISRILRESVGEQKEVRS